MVRIAFRCALGSRRCDARFEVIQETGRRAWQLAFEALDEFFFGQACQHR